MPQVIGVRLRYSKTLWFDPQEIRPNLGEIVLVSTERGEELGLVYQETHEVKQQDLPAELKPLIRIATQEDLEKAVELAELEKAAMPVFKEMIEKNGLNTMNPIDVEYVFSRDRIIFYFSADERVDFRTLVRDLASHFQARIDLRQIGVRDEARSVGGVGHCGELLCCARMGAEFAPVSIRMAKDQGLPLNPLKISGLCGRLMCCLRYEVDAYRDFNKRAPNRNANIDTPLGAAKVSERDALRELVTLMIDTGESTEKLDVPIASITCAKKRGSKENGCPCHISEEEFSKLGVSSGDRLSDEFSMPELVMRDGSNGESNESADGRRDSRDARTQRERTKQTGRKEQDRAKDDGEKASRKSTRRRRGGTRKKTDRNKQDQPQNQNQRDKQQTVGQEAKGQQDDRAKSVKGRRDSKTRRSKARPQRSDSKSSATAQKGSTVQQGEAPQNKPEVGERIPRRRRRR